MRAASFPDFPIRRIDQLRFAKQGEHDSQGRWSRRARLLANLNRPGIRERRSGDRSMYFGSVTCYQDVALPRLEICVAHPVEKGDFQFTTSLCDGWRDIRREQQAWVFEFLHQRLELSQQDIAVYFVLVFDDISLSLAFNAYVDESICTLCVGHWLEHRHSSRDGEACLLRQQGNIPVEQVLKCLARQERVAVVHCAAPFNQWWCSRTVNRAQS